MAKASHQRPLSYDCAEELILLGTAAIYWVAFLGAYFQNEGLLGEHGIMPARLAYWEPLRARFDSPWQGFLQSPSIFWWIPLSDASLNAVAVGGIVLSSLVLILGQSTWLWQALLWILYFSIISVADATSFYSYGWESQLLETGFLTIFLCMFPGRYGDGKDAYYFFGLWPPTKRGASVYHKPSPIIRWLFRWLIFRISLGAGLIKLRGSSCWMQKTCLYYHFETQPIPSPLSFFYHFLPSWAHRRMIDADFLVQVYTCWFVMVPPIGTLGRWLLRAGGVLQIGLMLGIIFSGNFAFLNHLTIIPALACLDDICWPRWLQRRFEQRKSGVTTLAMPLWRRAMDVSLLCTIGYLSLPVITNLWGKEGQTMNRSFDNFRLVNTYGAFGSVGTERYEPIVSISRTGWDWTELEFPCKPGDVYRRPCFCAPYHYRLDWNIWFLGFKPHKAYLQRREQWLYHLVAKLLIPTTNTSTDPRPWLDLLDRNTTHFLQTSYYEKREAPRYAKVDMYRYEMAAPLSRFLTSTEKLPWWNRTFSENLIPVVQWDPAQKRLQQVRFD